MRPEFQNFLEQVISAIVPVLVTTLAAGVTYLGKTLNTYIASKVSNERYAGTLQRLNEVITTVVLEIQQTEVDAIKLVTSEASPGGRRITQEEAKYLASKARDRAKAYLGDNGIQGAMYVMGFGKDFRRFDDFLTSRIEASVQEQKRLKPATLMGTGVGDTIRPASGRPPSIFPST